MKKILLALALICMVVLPIFSQTGSYTTHGNFYLPEYGAFGVDEWEEYNRLMEVADNQIEANKGTFGSYYLKTEIDTLSEVETIYSADIIDDTELAAYCETTQDYLKTSENDDTLDDVTLGDVQTATTSDFHNIGGADANTTYTGTAGEITLTGTVFSLASEIARDTELHNAVTLGTANGLSLSTQALSLALSSTSTTGALNDTDWDTFNNKQAPDTALTNISALTYVSPSFIKLTADDTYAVRTLAEVKTDLAYQLSDLSDVNTSTATDKFVLIADGVDFESRALADGDIPNTITISDLQVELDAGAHSIGFTLQSTTGDGTTTINWQLGNKFKFTFGAQNDTFTFTAPTNPCTLMLTLIQDGTGSRTITWPATCKWPGGTEGTLTTTANARDKVALDWDGTQYDCQMANDFK